MDNFHVANFHLPDTANREFSGAFFFFTTSLTLLAQIRGWSQNKEFAHSPLPFVSKIIMDHQAISLLPFPPQQALQERIEMATSPSLGDVVTVNMELTPENGMVLEPLFDTSGKMSFILGGGNYLPGIHELVECMKVGQQVKDISIDSGWGKRNPNLIVEVPKGNLKKMNSVDQLKVGSTLNLKGDFQVSVLKVTEDTVTVDANHPLAGSGYKCDLTLLSIDRCPEWKHSYHNKPSISDASNLEVATWAIGCFWGGELAFMRTKGVVGTKVGYTQGVKVNPTYDDVCKGETQHREAVLVTYDRRVVTYKELIKVYMDRLSATQKPYKLNIFDEEENSGQYSNGIYYHNEEQRLEAEKAVRSNKNKFDVELRRAAKFYDAEEYHQQYLLKGGQSARKGCKETIRCFG